MTSSDNTKQNDDYNRPRRPNPDTLSYLQSLPFDVKEAHDQISKYIQQEQIKKKQQNKNNTEINDLESEGEVEYPQILTAALAALDEIIHEIASLAGDEFGSQCIQTIASIVTPYSALAARKLLYGISGYMIHLSTHRYGSHVSQTILQLAVLDKYPSDTDKSAIKVGTTATVTATADELNTILELDSTDDTINGTAIPSIQDLILGIVEEILPVSRQLSEHVCGSHVLRTIICILGGVEEVLPSYLSNKLGGILAGGADRRGKIKAPKKKKKKVNSSSDNSSSNDGVSNSSNQVQLVPYRQSRFIVNDDAVREYLVSIINEVSGLDLKTICNEDDAKKSKQSIQSQPGSLQQLACHPSAGPLLIIILRVLSHISSPCNKTTHEHVENVLAANEISGDFRLGIQRPEVVFSPNSMAEEFTKQILCWDDKYDNDPKAQPYAGNVIYGLSGETRGSHLLEMILRLSHDELHEKICIAGGFYDKQSLEEYICHDVSNFVIQTLLNTARSKSQADLLLMGIEDMIGIGYVLDSKNRRRGIFWRVVEMAAKFEVKQEDIMKLMLKGFGTIMKNLGKIHKEEDIKVSDCIDSLIDYKAPDKEKGLIGFDRNGARSIYHLLRFHTRLCTDILSAIVSNYSALDLECIAKDGFGSRCIMDAILDGPTQQKPFSKTVKDLYEKLQGRWVALATERVGHHSVKKLFNALSKDDKKRLCDELSKGINRLNGNAMGRSVIIDCCVKDYLEGDMEWEAAIKKKLEKENFLKDITGEDEEIGRKRKRKRKRNKRNEEE
jgi:hypothetical protein